MRIPVSGILVVVLALGGTANGATAQGRPARPARVAPAPGLQHKPDDIRARFDDLIARRAAVRGNAPAGVAAVAAALGSEVEPNDTITTANLVSLGDTISGVIDPAGDFDYFAIDLGAGTVLEADVDAQVLGSPLDAVIGLFDTDGACCLAISDDWDGHDSRIVYAIPADGRYFVAIVDYSLRGGPGYTYQLAFRMTTLDEIEPNDTPATATLIALGDSVNAVLTPSTELDYFALDVPDRTLVRGELTPFEWFAGVVTLYATDGTTVLAADTVGGWPYGVERFIESAGRYYVSVHDLYPQYAGSRLYTLTVDSIPLGPGDPVTLFAAAQGVPRRVAVGAAGELYVVDDHSDRLLRVSSGAVTELARNLGIGSVVVDGLGDVLASGYDYQTGRAVVWRVTPSGSRSVFIDDGSSPYTVTIAPDGDVWMAACGQICPSLRRYDPTGWLKETVSIGAWPMQIAFSPDGTLHFSSWDGVYRLSRASAQRVIASDYLVYGLAFDEDGRLYVVSEFSGAVLRYSPTFERLEGAFARIGLHSLLDLAFGRDVSGAMTSRLFVAAAGWQASPPELLIYEVNPDGVDAPGFRIGVDMLRITAVPPDTARMGAAYARTLSVVNPPGAVTWSLERGVLPPGLSLDASSGTVSGTPASAGHYQCTVRATSGALHGFLPIEIVIVEPGLAVDDAVNAILGVAGTLTPELETYLDLQGNNNGQYDIGDLRAFLRARGALPAPPMPAGASERSGGP